MRQQPMFDVAMARQTPAAAVPSDIFEEGEEREGAPKGIWGEVMTELPIVEETVSQGEAMQAIRTAGAGAVAVRLEDGVSILPADTILGADVDQERIGVIARSEGILLPDDAFDLSGTSIIIDPAHGQMARFEAPPGYKQCQEDENHTYPLDYDRNVCWRDAGELLTVYLGD